MAPDQTVIDALEQALAAAPDNDAIRTHLIELLAAGSQWNEVLRHCTFVLNRHPDDLTALQKAAAACDHLGDAARSQAYRRLASALGGDGPVGGKVLPAAGAIPSDAPPSAVPAGGAPVEGPSEDKYDKFLREVIAAGDMERPSLTLADVGGLEEVKKRLNTSFLAPMRNPELRAMYGKSLRGGLLLYGPPGCGKTFLARAVAGELKAQFFTVGLHDVLDMWHGESEKKLHEIFETARRNAPCVLFLDEVDALGLKRSHLTHSAGRNVVAQLLAELDGTLADNEGVFLLGATNQPWDLDPALRRPGRFDRMLLVLPPDLPARVTILEYQLKNRPTVRLDLKRIAKATEGYSGADLRLVCESAAESAMEDSIESGTVRPIGMADVERAVREVAPSTRSWFDIAKNFALFANEGGIYDNLLDYMRRHRLG